MAITLDEFREDLINRIKADAIVNGDYPEDVFIDEAKDILINDFGVLSDLENVFVDFKTPNKNFRNMHLDAAYLEMSLNALHLLYCDFNDGEMQIINNEFVNQKVTLLSNYFYNVLKDYYRGKPESDSATQLARSIRKNLEQINKLHIVIISTNKNSTKIKTTFALEPLTFGTNKYNIDLTLLDIEKIYETKLAGFRKENIIIKTEDYGLTGIPCIKAEINSDDYDSYLAIVPGKFLNDIYQKYSARLLESNVRSFLNTKGEINKGILNTILNDKSRFFAYNNGISTTADSVELLSTDKGLLIKSFNNLQIINGGQTTASLASAVIKNNADLNGIYVQMKLSIIKVNDERADLVRLISKYANKQNKVTNADLNSNHPFYNRIEEYSRKIKVPLQPNTTIQTIWFFERARGQYDQAKMKLKTKNEREVFERQNPKNQKFTKTDLAKFINSDEMKPYDVSWGAEVNMTRFQVGLEKDWAKSNVKYNELYFKELIAKAIIYKKIEKIISNEDWYISNKGYRAQLVPYTFSKLMYEIKKLNKLFNYKKVWETQELADIYTNDIASISKICYDVFNDPNRQYLNIGEYAKRELCWSIIKDKEFNLSNDTIGLLINKEDKEVEVRITSKDQKFTNGICNEIDIFNAGIEYWQRVKEVGQQLNELNYYELSLCDDAIKYIKQIYTQLSKKQIKGLSEIMKRMEQYI